MNYNDYFKVAVLVSVKIEIIYLKIYIVDRNKFLKIRPNFYKIGMLQIMIDLIRHQAIVKPLLLRGRTLNRRHQPVFINRMPVLSRV